MKTRFLSLFTLCGVVASSGPLVARAIESGPPQTSDTAAVPASAAPQFSGRINEVVSLSKSGVDQSIVLSFIKASPGPFQPSADEIIKLRDMGVSTPVLTAMLERGAELREQARTAVAANTSNQGSANPSQAPVITETPPSTYAGGDSTVYATPPASTVTYIGGGYSYPYYSYPYYSYYSYPYYYPTYYSGWYSSAFFYPFPCWYGGRYYAHGCYFPHGGYVHDGFHLHDGWRGGSTGGFHGGFTGGFHGGVSGGFRGGIGGGFHGGVSGGFHSGFTGGFRGGTISTGFRGGTSVGAFHTAPISGGFRGGMSGGGFRGGSMGGGFHGSIGGGGFRGGSMGGGGFHGGMGGGGGFHGGGGGHR